MTAFLDWISQHLTTAPMWIQSPIVILGAVLVCALLSAVLMLLFETPTWSGIMQCWIPLAYTGFLSMGK